MANEQNKKIDNNNNNKKMLKSKQVTKTKHLLKVFVWSIFIFSSAMVAFVGVLPNLPVIQQWEMRYDDFTIPNEENFYATERAGEYTKHDQAYDMNAFLLNGGTEIIPGHNAIRITTESGSAASPVIDTAVFSEAPSGLYMIAFQTRRLAAGRNLVKLMVRGSDQIFPADAPGEEPNPQWYKIDVTEIGFNVFTMPTSVMQWQYIQFGFELYQNTFYSPYVGLPVIRVVSHDCELLSENCENGVDDNCNNLIDGEDPMCIEEEPEILFEEGFEDAGFASRGWYDNTNLQLSSTEKHDGNYSLQYHFNANSIIPVSGDATRHLFSESEGVYLSYYVKYGNNWQGTGHDYGPHEFQFITNQDEIYIGPASTHLTTYIEQNEGEPILSIQDAQNINYDYINQNIVNITEDRAVAGCNGDSDGYGGDCYWAGYEYRNGKTWRADNIDITDGTWHRVEVKQKLNSIVDGIGVADGVFKYWLDGNLVIDINDMMYRTAINSNMKFNQFLMAPYFHDYTDQAQDFYVDSLIVGNYSENTGGGDEPVCTDLDGDGYGEGVDCLGLDCDDNNISVHQELNCNYNGTACGSYNICTASCPVPPSENCSDGTDNDCDGDADGTDSDCTTGDGWTKEITFEGGQIGLICGAPDTGYQGDPIHGFSGSTGNTSTFSNTEVHTGVRSCDFFHPINSDDYGEAGAYIGFDNCPSSEFPCDGWLHEGDKVWYRMYTYFKSPWSWDHVYYQGSVAKVMRIYPADAQGGSGGWGILSILARLHDAPIGGIMLSNEPAEYWSYGTGQEIFDTDRWQSIEMGIKVSATPGQGYFRMWKNGNLIANDEQNETILSSDLYYAGALVMSNWNGLVPQNQHQYVDDFVLTTETPQYTDAQGHPMIGPITCPTGSTAIEPLGSCMCGNTPHTNGYCCNGNWQSGQCN